MFIYIQIGSVADSFVRAEQHLFFFENSLQQAHAEMSLFSWVSTTKNSIMRGFEECTTKKNPLCLSLFLAPPFLSVSQRASVFSCHQGSSCSEHLVVAFREHSGRQEESDGATVGTLEMSAPEAGRQGGIE